MNFEYGIANSDDLEIIWNKNILDNIDDSKWVDWKNEYLKYNSNNMAYTFIIKADNQPVGEGTLIVSQNCSAIRGRLNLSNNKNIGNINALRISKKLEGKGHISKLMKCIETFAMEKGINELTIGVEAKETRNLAIYLHWGYDIFVMFEKEDEELVLYYKKIVNYPVQRCINIEVISAMPY